VRDGRGAGLARAPPRSFTGGDRATGERRPPQWRPRLGVAARETVLRHGDPSGSNRNVARRSGNEARRGRRASARLARWIRFAGAGRQVSGTARASGVAPRCRDRSQGRPTRRPGLASVLLPPPGKAPRCRPRGAGRGNRRRTAQRSDHRVDGPRTDRRSGRASARPAGGRRQGPTDLAQAPGSGLRSGQASAWPAGVRTLARTPGRMGRPRRQGERASAPTPG
jgi:hypothetical protein